MARYDIEVDSKSRMTTIRRKGQTFCAYKVSFDDAAEFIKKPALDDCGVYLLLRDVDGEDPKVYVGEAESVATRLAQHISARNKGKEFPWTEAILFVNKNDEWVKSDVKYLENHLYSNLASVNRYVLINGNTPKKSKVADPPLLDDHICGIKDLVSYLGHPKLFVAKTVVSPKSKVKPSTPPPPQPQKKVGAIAREWFPKLFTDGKITAADIAYLCSHQAVLDFKTKGHLVLKEYKGNKSDYLDANGARRYYSIPPMTYGDKSYLLTHEFFPDSTRPVIDWLKKHGATIA